MNILWFTWKDITHPQAGGAEVVASQLGKRLVADGHTVTFVVAGYKGAAAQQTIDGYQVVRVGSRLTVYWQAYRHYQKHLRGWPDLVIDEMNTIPFFAKFYVKEPHLMFIHMLCRQIWWYETMFPISLFGYLIEPLYLRLFNDQRVITISDSTKQDLLRHGFKDKNISIISEGIEFEPIKDLKQLKKLDRPTMLVLGGMRAMKQTDHCIQAFHIAKQHIPDLQLIVAGSASGKHGQKCLAMIDQSPYASSITYAGRVSQTDKIKLMQQSNLIAVASVKEGWGLIVTEANSQGTPAVVYNADGLRDSVKHTQSGLITQHNTPQSMANAIIELLSSPQQYTHLQHQAWQWSKDITFDRSYEEFKKELNI